MHIKSFAIDLSNLHDWLHFSLKEIWPFSTGAYGLKHCSMEDGEDLRKDLLAKNDLTSEEVGKWS